VVEPNAVSKLVRHFVTPGLARSPECESRKSGQLAHRWQALEYVTSQNLEKRRLRSAELYSGGSGRSERLARRSINNAAGSAQTRSPRTRI